VMIPVNMGAIFAGMCSSPGFALKKPQEGGKALSSCLECAGLGR